MKFIKNNFKILITVFITMIITAGVSVFAAYNIFAKDVEYVKADGTKTSVKNALDELYSNSIANLEFVMKTETLRPNASTNQSTSITLDPGKYLIIGMAKSAQWNTSCNLTGDDSITFSGARGFWYWNENEPSHVEDATAYEYGRGGSHIYPYIVNLTERKTLTGTIGVVVDSSNYNYWTNNKQLYGVGGFIVYKI